LTNFGDLKLQLLRNQNKKTFMFQLLGQLKH